MLRTTVSRPCAGSHCQLVLRFADFSSPARSNFLSARECGGFFPGTSVAICNLLMAFPLAGQPNDTARARAPQPSVLRQVEHDDIAKPRRIVALGGGTGLPAVLEGLAELAAEKGEHDRYAVTGIVTVTDDGGSSGRLRQQLGVLPPGDARNCLLALADQDSYFQQLLQHRVGEGPGVVGHPLGNLLLAALTQQTGDFSRAIDQLGSMIGSRGRVLPSTLEHVCLRAELESGETANGETEIVRDLSPVRRLSLAPTARPLPDALAALVNAEGIVVGPGSLYTSVLPNLLVDGVAATIHGVNAVRIYVANLMTEPGETEHYTLDDHLRVIRAHTGFNLFDYILVNRRPIDEQAARLYAAQRSEPVVAERVLRYAGDAEIVECDLAIEWGGKKIRHHPRSLGRAIRALVRAGRRGSDTESSRSDEFDGIAG
jgi:uncharacterized cofD-like protein